MRDRTSKRRVINAVAPIRICDLGGWTDTWFAEVGAVLNFGVYPYAEVQIYVSQQRPEQGEKGGRITIHAENFGDRYHIEPGPAIEYDRHPLLEASIDIMELPRDLSFEINLYSSAPAGCSTGTSAAVSVALLGALDLLTPGQRTPHEIAALAHRVETEKLKLQCGIQDQLCSAYGGICFIEMFRYPFASVSQLAIPNNVWWSSSAGSFSCSSARPILQATSTARSSTASIGRTPTSPRSNPCAAPHVRERKRSMPATSKRLAAA